MNEIYTVIFAFGTIFCFLLSFVQYVKPNVGLNNIFLSLVYLAGATLSATAYLNVQEYYFEMRFLNYVYVPFLYLAGPAVYYFFYATVDKSFQLSKRVYFGFSPFFIALLLLPVLYAVDPQSYAISPLEVIVTGKYGPPDVMFITAFVFNFVYTLLLIRRSPLVFEYKLGADQKAPWLFLGLFVFIALLSLFAFFAVVFGALWLMFVAASMICLVAVFTFIFANRYPEYFSNLEIQLENQNLQTNIFTFENTQIDPVQMHIDLVSLMLDQRLYENESLTINTVADELKIKPYLLSEYLNNYLNINFSQFVKNFRVDAAKKMLMADPEANFLTVAYRVGFNSKTTFNVSFKQLTGKSPRDFVKEFRNKDSSTFVTTTTEPPPAAESPSPSEVDEDDNE